jgi:thiamine-monophosphate kinase
MDITDGLGQSLTELSEASQIGFDIDVEALPLHPLTWEVSKAIGVDPYEIAFGIGLDLELLVTFKADRLREAESVGLTAFGSARAGFTQVRAGGRPAQAGVPGRGWEHFGGDASDFVARAHRPETS